MYISKSFIESFIRCPRKAKYQYIERIPYAGSIAMTIGTDFHQFAGDFFGWIDYDKLKDMTDLVEVRNMLLNLIPDYIHMLVRPLCENFVDFEAKRWVQLKESYGDDAMYYYKPVDVEVKMRSDVDKLSGIVDRTDRLTTGYYVLIEYKTGSRLDEKSLRRELAFYQILLESVGRYDKAITNWAAYNPRTGQYMYIKSNASTTRAVWRRIRQVRNAIDTDDFPCREGFSCFYCSYTDVCPKIKEVEK